MVVSGEHRPHDGSHPHELTSNTHFPSLMLYVLSLSVLSVALLTYLCIRLSRTSKKRKTLARETNSPAPSRPSYEVFLSFRGADSRHEFTDFLYHGMIEAGILVFRDSESLHVGRRISDELLQAIENSKIYVPIFSKNYASSHWCLRELAHMVECTSKSNGYKEILPIFLDVEPDDVKLKTKLYSKAVSKHQKKFCAEVESWKEALFEVDEIKGWNWKKDESQVRLIQSVIQTVLAKLNVGFKKNVTEDLVGVDDLVEAMIEMLHEKSGGVQFLGIHGMGGIGKTTLARVIFNLLSSRFQGCNFLSDIGESSRRHGMVHLQKQLLSKFPDACSILDQIHDVDDGTNVIKRVLCCKKVLIVLDDVDEKEQLKVLAGKGNWFGSGSRIIITTRDQSVLMIEREATGEGAVEKSAEVLIYEVREMEFDHALNLFSRHAFRRDSPPCHYLSLSKEVVSTLGKLPLALEITGSSLNGKSEALWVDTLKKLKEAPHMEVQRKLMITYERLDHAQKEVFLDIACFFVNRDKTYPFYMWDSCGYCPHNAIEVLFIMSLVKIRDDNTFWMHDQVRDLGREIVRQENFKNPCKRSRVWNHKEALNILKWKEGSRKIEALSTGRHEDLFREDIIPNLRFFPEDRVPTKKDIILEHDEFAALRNLRFFQGDRVSLVGDFNNLLSNLRWLSWQSCPSKFEATNFHPTNLVVLDLSHSYISNGWIGWNQIGAARKLKVLDLSHCKKLMRTPDLSACMCLERLILRRCSQLIEVDPSIGELQSLVELDLSWTSIAHLPDSIGNLKQLKVFRMSGMIWMTKPPSAIWGMEKLEELDLSFTSILELSTMVSRLSNLQTLNLDQCDELKQLPELPLSLTCLTWTTKAEVGSYELESHATLPTSMEALTSYCENVQFLAKLPSRLSTKFCMGSEVLHMELCRIRKLDALFQLGMQRLRKLEMRRCDFIPEILDLSRMKNLQEIHLFVCKMLVKICGLEELETLCSLTIEGCWSMERMSDLSKLKKLKKLIVRHCPKLRSAKSLNHLESLKELSIFNAGEFRCDTSNLNIEHSW